MNTYESLKELSGYINAGKLISEIQATKGTISLTLSSDYSKNPLYFQELASTLHDETSRIMLESRLSGFAADLGLNLSINILTSSYFTITIADSAKLFSVIESIDIGSAEYKESKYYIETIFAILNASMGKYLDGFLGFNPSVVLPYGIEKDYDPDYYFMSYEQLRSLYGHRDVFMTLCHQKGLCFPIDHLLYVKKHFDLGLLKELEIMMFLVNISDIQHLKKPTSLLSYMDSLLKYNCKNINLHLQFLIKWSDMIISRIESGCYSADALEYLYDCFSDHGLTKYLMIRVDGNYHQYMSDIHSNFEDIVSLLNDKKS